jgi:3-deoxy-D-manno-octulosonic acid (KDO) 8-phosphate synthase
VVCQRPQGRAAGGDALLTRSEFHPDPDKALSGGAQSLDFVTFERLLVQLKMGEIVPQSNLKPPPGSAPAYPFSFEEL